MKRAICITAGLLLAATAASAQPAAGRVGIASRLRQSYAQMKRDLTEAADKMTDADATFKPAPEIRTFAGQFAHVAQFHYNYCSQVKGGTNPNTADLEQTATTKAAVVKALADSFAYCNDAFLSLTDETANQFIAVGGAQLARAVPLINFIAHDSEEYGIITVYLRLKSLVPPSTENAGRGRGGPAGGAPGRQ